MNACDVLADGNDAQATPLPVDFRYCPLVPVAPPAVIVPLNVALPVVNVSVSVKPVTLIPVLVVFIFSFP